MANGAPIDDYHVQPGPVSIGYSLAFEERQARVEEGLTAEEYDALPGTPQWIIPGGPEWTKCHVIMGYRMAQRIPVVGQDAQNREMQRKMKRGGR